jgi:transposase
VGGALAGTDLGGRGAGGLGHLLARQLVAAGERVLDVQPKPGARVRLLAAGASNKNDPGDARSAAVAALRSTGRREVTADDHQAVLKVRARRHRDLGRARNQVACRLRAVLCDLIPGGISKEITAAQAARVLEQAEPSGAVDTARCELAAEFPGDLRRTGARLRDTKKKLAVAVRASGTTVTGIFGVGPVIAGTVIGDIGDVFCFPGRDHFAACNGTAPAGVPSGDRKTCRLSLRGNRRISDAIHARLHAGARRARRSSQDPRAPEGSRGTTLSPARPDCTPETGPSDKPLPSPVQPYGPPPHASEPRR